MGISHLPSIDLYWSKNNIYGHKLIPTIMSRDRFDMLLKFYQLSDNEDPPANNDIISPGERTVIDETMVPWRGRLVFRQYLPAKAHKYGIKLYKICTTEGYTYDLRIYARKNNANVPEQGYTYTICLEVNYYISLKLCKDLLSSRTYICGTL